jgi:hypothetical protein
MPCCVITGRLLDPINRQGTPVSFKKYILNTMEGKLKELILSESPEITAESAAGIEPVISVTTAAEEYTGQEVRAPVAAVRKEGKKRQQVSNIKRVI